VYFFVDLVDVVQKDLVVAVAHDHGDVLLAHLLPYVININH